jgi:hypothetical protein
MNMLLGNGVESSTNLGCWHYIQDLEAKCKKYEQLIQNLEAECQKYDYGRENNVSKQQSLGSGINQARLRFLNDQRRSACC